MSHQGLSIDLMCGLGGTSEGYRQSTGKSPDIVVNHNAHAIALHERNHPDSRHFCDDIRALNPLDITGGKRVGLITISPDCRHFSRAKGSAPVSVSVRALAWETVRWAKETRPSAIYLENVPEFQSWGPVDADGQPIAASKGDTFREFLVALNDLGYNHDSRILNAADYGTPTTRKRFFLGARRDGCSIPWPIPSHGPGRPKPWRSAAECIDWSIPVPSIFERKRPLADATCRRIAHGIMRYVMNGKPFIVNLRGTDPSQIRSSPSDLELPLRTISTSNHHGLVTAFPAKHYTGVIGQSLDCPMGTVTSIDHHSLITGNLIQIGARHGRGAQALDTPVATMLTTQRFALVAAFLVHYYGSGTQNQPLSEPMHTVVTKARHGLVTVTIEGEQYALADIGLRMLTPRELARAQGFPDDYLLEGSQSDQIARIGNAVCPPVAEALLSAYYGFRPSLS